jgi:L-iditol 2-dehydrogenase
VVVLGDRRDWTNVCGSISTSINRSVAIWGQRSALQIGDKLGAAKTFNYRQLEDTPAVVRGLTAGYGADVVIEATGSASSLGNGDRLCASWCNSESVWGLSTRHHNYGEYRTITLQRIDPKRRVSQHSRYVRAALSLLASRAIPFELLISEHQPLKHLEQVFQDMKNRQVIKVAIY